MLGRDFLAKYGVPRAAREAFDSPDEVRWGEYPIWVARKGTAEIDSGPVAASRDDPLGLRSTSSRVP
jgi:hypothetical protein